MGKAEDILALRAGKAYINRGYWTKEDKSRLQEMYCIVNTLENRYIPIFKLGSHAAWFKRGILPLLNCVNYNGVDLSEIALILQRSERAISVQIDKLGLRERSRCSWKKKEGCLCQVCSLYDRCKGKRTPCKNEV